MAVALPLLTVPSCWTGAQSGGTLSPSCWAYSAICSGVRGRWPAPAASAAAPCTLCVLLEQLHRGLGFRVWQLTWQLCQARGHDPAQRHTAPASWACQGDALTQDAPVLWLAACALPAHHALAGALQCTQADQLPHRAMHQGAAV